MIKPIFDSILLLLISEHGRRESGWAVRVFDQRVEITLSYAERLPIEEQYSREREANDIWSKGVFYDFGNDDFA